MFNCGVYDCLCWYSSCLVSCYIQHLHFLCFVFFFFKQKTAYEMRISDWSSDVCSSDLDQNKRDNALLFAVKRAASFDIHDNNIDHLVRWLLYCARRSATCLGFVAEHLSAISGTTSLPDDEIHAYILQQIPVKAASGHTHELAWLLFWADRKSTRLN